MAELKVVCTNQQITWVEDPAVIYAGNKNIDSISFSFCELWDGFVKTAIFYRNKDEAYQILLDENNKCIIPPELSQDNGLIYVGVIGDKGEQRRTTEPVCWYLREGIPTEGIPSEPTADIYQQILSVCNETYKIANAVREEAENGAFDGADGKDGHTPQKGIDYFTPEDIESLNIPIVDAELNENSNNAIANSVVVIQINSLYSECSTAYHMATAVLEQANLNLQRINELYEEVGDIDAALEELHNYAQNLIGGAE